MKKYLVLILGAALFSCTQQPKGFKINVALEGAEEVLLEQPGGSSLIPIDTAVVVDGIAVLEGEVDMPGPYYLSVVGQRPKTVIFVENTEMTVVGKADSLNMANDTLYGYYDGNLYELDASATPLQMQYISPVYIGAGYTVPKSYKNFYMYSEGVVSIEIFIDGVSAQSKTFTTKDNHQIKIPTQYTRGHSLQFSIVGTGTVYEVQWDEGDVNQ